MRVGAWNSLFNTHNGHPIARPPDMGCLLWQQGNSLYISYKLLWHWWRKKDYHFKLPTHCTRQASVMQCVSLKTKDIPNWDIVLIGDYSHLNDWITSKILHNRIVVVCAKFRCDRIARISNTGSGFSTSSSYQLPAEKHCPEERAHLRSQRTVTHR